VAVITRAPAKSARSIPTEGQDAGWSVDNSQLIFELDNSSLKTAEIGTINDNGTGFVNLGVQCSFVGCVTCPRIFGPLIS
jgi:hypothetical protein